MSANWTAATDNSSAAKRVGGRKRINHQRQTDAFFLGLQVLNLAHQGLLPLEIARELKVSAVTAYRHYWRHFGKRRPAIAREKAFARRIEAEEARIARLMEAEPPKVDRLKLAELLEVLRLGR